MICVRVFLWPIGLFQFPRAKACQVVNLEMQPRKHIDPYNVSYVALTLTFSLADSLSLTNSKTKKKKHRSRQIRFWRAKKQSTNHRSRRRTIATNQGINNTIFSGFIRFHSSFPSTFFFFTFETMSIAASSMFPGFRFCPTDDELISYYLRKKLDGHEESVQVISEIEICRCEPWDLPAKSFIQSDNEWFFFSPRGRKYPNGSQSKRATECGYWKATGKERNVKSGSNVIGTKRTLVFHMGRAPKGERTEWIMHEYCINDKSQDSLVVCRLKRNTEFRLNDAPNRASSSQVLAVNSHESNCAISEAETDQRAASEQDKGVGCSSKRSSCSYGSPSVEQIDSASESNQRPANDTALTESSSHQKEVDEEDCYAEILKDDIIKLDESSLSSQEGHNELRDHTMIPSQGTAQRRIRLRVEKGKKKKQSLASGVRFPSSMHSSKRRPLLGTLTTSRFMLLSLFFVLTLIALYLLSLLVVGNLKQVKSCGKFGFGCKL